MGPGAVWVCVRWDLVEVMWDLVGSGGVWVCVKWSLVEVMCD